MIKTKYTMVKHPGQQPCIHGPYMSYHNDGKMYIKCGYHNGEYHGDYVEYTKKGALQIKCNYIVGKLDGEYCLYNTDNIYNDESILFSVVTYKMGKRHGSFKVYDKHGAMSNQSWWHDDKFICFYSGELTAKQKFYIEMTGRSPFAENLNLDYSSTMSSILEQELNDEEDE